MRTAAASDRRRARPGDQYLTDWVAGKTRYGLTVDPAEHTALTEKLAHCSDQPVTVTLARY
ncbi:hypothetical protein [Streptomyces sp. NPDC003483]